MFDAILSLFLYIMETILATLFVAVQMIIAIFIFVCASIYWMFIALVETLEGN